MSGERRGQPGPQPSGKLRQLLQAGWTSLSHNGYLKLGAFLAAAVFWIFVSNDDSLVSQRIVRAPLNVEGLSPEQRVPGVPERVEVRLSGPASRLGSIRPDGVDAVLNLRGISGDFEADVRVFLPQGISLVGVNPSEIIGTVEGSAQKRVPVYSVFSAPAPDDAVIEVSPSPGEVTVSGAESLVAQVTQVVVPFNPLEARERAAPYAVDAEGNPVGGVSVTPRQIRLRAARQDILYVRTVPLGLAPLTLSGLEVRSAQLSFSEITVVGSKEALASVEGLTATLPQTPPLAPGQYTLDVALALPEGVRALEAPQLTLQLRARR